MNTVKRLSSVLLLCVAALASDATIPIADRSPAGSPLQNTGTVIVSAIPANSKTVMSYQDDWTIKNVSPKPVMAFVATLQVQYPNGQVVQRIQEHDAFFHSQLINTGEDLNVNIQEPRGKMLVKGAVQLDMLDASPAADATVRWVQFADGTTFGDEKFALEILDLRKAIWTTLAHLNDVYRTGGAERFLQELQAPKQGQVDGYVDHLRAVQKKNGTEAAYRQLQFHLKMAEERRQFMR